MTPCFRFDKYCIYHISGESMTQYSDPSDITNVINDLNKILQPQTTTISTLQQTVEYSDEPNKIPTDYTPLENADEIFLIIDRSGSMQGLRSDAEGGINAFIKEQLGISQHANVTVTQFDSTVENLYERAPIEIVPEYKLRPRGMTALLDAVGMTLSKYRDHKTTGKKIGVIVTDGHENSSKEWTREAVRDLTEELRAEGWEFVFLAADEDAIEDSHSWGMQSETSIRYDTAVAGATNDAWLAATSYTSALRTGHSVEASRDIVKGVVNSSATLSMNVEGSNKSE